MKAAGKNIRYFSDEFFNTNSLETIGKTLNQEEWEYYRPKVSAVQTKEGNEMYERERNRIKEFLTKVESDKERYLKICLDKQKKFPQPNRISEDKLKQDISHIVGNPFTGDESYLDKLRDYAGEVEQGINPVVNIGETK